MISGLTGRIVSSLEGEAEIEVGGVRFKVFAPRRYVRQLRLGSEAHFFTYLYHNREEAFELFGFLSAEELDIFKLLISVSGVGPRMALNILSAASPDRLAAAVSQGRSDIIEKAQGVGKKTAQRIILELKDKFKVKKISSSLGLEEEGVDQEIVEALSALGYKRTAVKDAVEKIDPKLTKLGERLKDALKKIK
ncbi:MAG: Holliday junction branch migration protein RuvA [Patescibacteria group bacterium]|nr:Holliday junction branch migration protein RuvA [Patescibacteria group bacterium]